MLCRNSLVLTLLAGAWYKRLFPGAEWPFSAAEVGLRKDFVPSVWIRDHCGDWVEEEDDWVEEEMVSRSR